MNVILLIIIFIIIVYIIYITNVKPTKIKNTIEHNTNIETSKLNLDNSLPNKDIILSNNILKKLNYNNNTFKLIGTALNKYYNQKYYLYESKNDQYGDLLMRNNLDYLNEQQLYSYIFVLFNNNEPNIEQEFGPRMKINIGDVIYLDKKYMSNGLGPYIIL
jgi:hypothetical protein